MEIAFAFSGVGTYFVVPSDSTYGGRMTKLCKFGAFIGFVLVSVMAHAKLSDRQAMKCLSQDRNAESAFSDLEQAYGMRLVTAKDFFDVIDKASDCSQLKKNVKKLRADMVSRFPDPSTIHFSPEEPSQESQTFLE
jgi:hypothetical protein